METNMVAEPGIQSGNDAPQDQNQNPVLGPNQVMGWFGPQDRVMPQGAQQGLPTPPAMPPGIAQPGFQNPPQGLPPQNPPQVWNPGQPGVASTPRAQSMPPNFNEQDATAGRRRDRDQREAEGNTEARRETPNTPRRTPFVQGIVQDEVQRILRGVFQQQQQMNQGVGFWPQQQQSPQQNQGVGYGPPNAGMGFQAPYMNANTGYPQGTPSPGQFPHGNMNPGYNPSNPDQNKRVTLDEKYFRRCEKFDGDTFKFRAWLFDLLVAIGQIDGTLYDSLKDMLYRARDEEFDPASYEGVNHQLYEKYKSELYGVVVSLTVGEAKSVVRGISESGNNNDGFKALVVLQCRYDKKTKANLLRTFLDVTNPPGIKGVNTIIKSIHAWESKVSVLKSRYDHTLDKDLKIAILVGMMPQEYQDICMQASLNSGDLKYEGMRDHIINIAHQRVEMIKPVPMDVGSLNKDENQDETDLDAVNRNTKCYNCQGFGHMANQCPTPKGEGKGMPPGKGDFGKGGYKGYSPKGGSKGYTPKGGGKGSFGKGGKGFQGLCWTCNKPGHRADQCKGIQECTEGEQATEECAVEIGGVWDLACVECGPPFFQTSNRFQVLEEEEYEDLPGLVSESEEEKPGLDSEKEKAGFPKLKKTGSGYKKKKINSARIHKWKTFNESGFAESQRTNASPGNAYKVYKGQHEDRADNGQSEINYSGMNYPNPVELCVVEEKKVN